MTFDPDKFIAEYDAQPAAEGVPPLLARPNAGNVPDYTAAPPPAVHDEVKPGQAAAVRAEIAKVTSAPGFHEMPPGAQQSAIIDAVHAVTRAVGDFRDAAGKAFGAAIPFGHVTGAAAESLLGNKRPFGENLDAMDQAAAQAKAAHPVAGILGTTAGLGATVAASGGFGSLGLAPAAAGATMPAAGPGLARAMAPIAGSAVENGAIGGIQGAGETAARGGDVNDVLREGANGAIAGATVGAAIPLAGAAVGKTLLGAVNRSDSRMLKEIQDGAQAPVRRSLAERGDEVVDLVRKTPSLEKTWKNPKEFTAAAKVELGKNGAQLDDIYSAADKGGKIDPITAVRALTAVKNRLNSSLSTEEVSEAMAPTIDKLQRHVEAEKKLTLQQARAGLQKGISPRVIEDMAAGNRISSSELRAEITRLQDIAYKKGPGADPTNVQQAAAEAAKALKDVLEKHVETNLPGQLQRVQELNKDQTILSRIKGASEFKAVNKPGENGSRLTTNIHNAVKFGAGAAGAGTLGAGIARGSIPEIVGGIAEAAAPHVIPPAARAVDEGLAKVGRSAGVTRTESLSPLTQRLTMAKNPGQVKNELMSHIFGGNSSREDIPEPESFGPPTTSGEEPESFGPAK